MIISNCKGLDIKVEAKSPNKGQNKPITDNISHQTKDITNIQNPLTFYSCYGYVAVKKEDMQENSLVPIYKKIKESKPNQYFYTPYGSVHVR
jgi:hypothetical protein